VKERGRRTNKEEWGRMQSALGLPGDSTTSLSMAPTQNATTTVRASLV